MFPFRPSDLLDLSQCPAIGIFDGCEYVWQALPRIRGFLSKNLRPKFRGKKIGRPFIGEDVFVGEGTIVEDGAFLKGPAIIGRNCQIRHGAYIRENVIAGDNCVLGNASEFKNCVLFNGATVPHFNYVGDSILGYQAHLGAGVKISNVKLVRSNIILSHEGQRIDTGLSKFGAILGDYTDIGCNAVLNPGSIIGRRSAIYPNISWLGICPPDSIIKFRPLHQLVRRRG